jgi:MFS family permease
MGLTSALFWPAMEAKVADRGDQDLGRRLSRFNVSWSSGSGLGTLSSGFLAGADPRLPFLAAAAVLILLGLRLATLLLRGDRTDHSPGHPPQEEAHPEDRQAPAFLLMARMVHFGVTFCIGSIRWLFPKLAVTFGMPEAQIGIILGLLTGAFAVAFLVMGHIRRWPYAFGWLLVPLLLTVSGLILAYGVTSAPGFGLAFLVIGLSGGMSFHMGLFYSVHGHRTKGSNAGLHEAIGALGSMVGPLLGGAVARRFSLPAINLLDMAVVGIVLFGIVLFWRSVGVRSEGEGIEEIEG